MPLRKQDQNETLFRSLAPRRIIDRIGIELEGGWAAMPAGVDRVRDGDDDYCQDASCGVCRDRRTRRESGRSLPPPCDDAPVRAHWHEDGSVRFDADRPAFVGEIVSVPLTGFRAVREWIHDYYPQRSNKTCGLHVHLSFLVPTSYVAGLLSDNGAWFDRQFRSAMLKWAEANDCATDAFRERIDGCNPYCRAGIITEADRTDRYRQVNLCSVSRHGTVEVRLLPMFCTKEKATSAIRAVVATMDRLIRYLIGRERHTPATVAASATVSLPAGEPIRSAITFGPQGEARAAQARTAGSAGQAIATIQESLREAAERYIAEVANR